MEYEILELEPQPCAVVAGEAAVSGLPDFFARAFTAVYAELERQGVAATGAPFARYPAMPGETVVVEAGFPTAGAIEAAEEVVPCVLPGGTTITTVHQGPYEAMDGTYAELTATMADRALEPAGPPWEVYLSDPRAEPDPATWRTQIFWPVSPKEQ